MRGNSQGDEGEPASPEKLGYGDPRNPYVKDWKLVSQDIKGWVVDASDNQVLQTWDEAILYKMRLTVEGHDVDIKLEVDDANVGVNINKLREYGSTTPNNDWWLSRVDTTVAPPLYYLYFLPSEFYGKDITLSVTNNESSSRSIEEGRVIYRVEEGRR